MTREQCRKTAEIFNALADGKTIKPMSGQQLKAEGISGTHFFADSTIVEPPPTITEHGRTYVLQPLPEKPKPLEVWTNVEGVQCVRDGVDCIRFSAKPTPTYRFKFVHVLEDENGK